MVIYVVIVIIIIVSCIKHNHTTTSQQTRHYRNSMGSADTARIAESEPGIGYPKPLRRVRSQTGGTWRKPRPAANKQTNKQQI